MSNKKTSRKYGIGTFLFIGVFLLATGELGALGIVAIIGAILWIMFQTREGAKETDSYGNPI